MDFIEGLPRSQGYEVIMEVVDRLSKYAHFLPIARPYTALSVARAFMDQIFKLHGMPPSIISDRDLVFTSIFWKELFKLQGTQLKHSSAYHPQTDGQTEVMNRCLESYLCYFVGVQPQEWAKWLSLAEWWYNTSLHSSKGMTPFEAVYGIAPPRLLSYILGTTHVQAVDKQLKSHKQIATLLKENPDAARQRMKRQADLHRPERSFQTVEWVYLRLQPYRQNSVAMRRNLKLSPRFCGPYQVLQKIGNVVYKLALPSDSRIHPVFHVPQLKKKLGQVTPQTTLPHILDGLPQAIPEAIIARWLVKRRDRAVAEVLVQWVGASEDNATWENYNCLQARFSAINLEDKVLLRDDQ